MFAIIRKKLELHKTRMNHPDCYQRELANAILYLVDSDCKWRQLPHDSTVHSFYRHARLNDLWERIRAHRVIRTRRNAGRKEAPTYGLIGSQSFKTTVPSEEQEIDRGKDESVIL